jgi:hypothetical protein
MAARGAKKVFQEISDLAAIRAAQKALTSKLKKEFPFPSQRKIGYPAGSFAGAVRFEKQAGAGVRWWFIDATRKDVWLCFVGRGDPESAETLNIDLQFNFSAASFSRKYGGAFVRDLETGVVFLCHRGIVTRGKSRVPLLKLLSVLPHRMEDVIKADGAGSIPLFVVSPILARSNTLSLTSDFAADVRAAATVAINLDLKAIAPGKQPRAKRGKGKSAKPNRTWSMFDSILESYFTEFTGTTVVTPSKQAIRNCRHGAVVNALRAKFSAHGTVMNSRFVDLAVVAAAEATIYEVKTSSQPQSLYTAIGQLILHGGALKRQYPGKRIKRVVVMPDLPNVDAKRFEKELGISLLQYTDEGSSILFT